MSAPEPVKQKAAHERFMCGFFVVRPGAKLFDGRRHFEGMEGTRAGHRPFEPLRALPLVDGRHLATPEIGKHHGEQEIGLAQAESERPYRWDHVGVGELRHTGDSHIEEGGDDVDRSHDR